MANSIATADRRAPVQSLELPLMGEARRRGEGPTTFQGPEGEWILTVVAEAIDVAMPRKEAASLMGLDQSQMTKQLHGDGHLSVRRLGALDDRFWRALADTLRARFELQDRSELIAQGEALIDRGRQLLAKAAAR